MMSLPSSRLDALIGSPESAAAHAARHRVDQGDVMQARAMRARGWGWQTIANILRVNATSLRIECGDLPRPEAQAGAGASGPRRALRNLRPLRADSGLAAGLLAIAGGARNTQELSSRAGLLETYGALDARRRSQQIATELVARGFITPSWSLTPEGEAEAARLGALMGDWVADA